jgi:hypothetical protein
VYQNRVLRRIFGSERMALATEGKGNSEIVFFIQY